MLINRSAIRKQIVSKGLKKPSYNHVIFQRIDRILSFFVDDLCENSKGKKKLDGNVNIHNITFDVPES